MREIKSYLHLYLGCDVMFNGSKWILTGVHRSYCVLDGGVHGVIKIEDFSLIGILLRPLSDIKEEEIEGYHAIDSIYPTTESLREYNIGIAAQQTAYLLSLHFDLFSLIESGLAIDAKTIKP